jgi:hypothetical protein
MQSEPTTDPHAAEVLDDEEVDRDQAEFEAGWVEATDSDMNDVLEASAVKEEEHPS